MHNIPKLKHDASEITHGLIQIEFLMNSAIRDFEKLRDSMSETKLSEESAILFDNLADTMVAIRSRLGHQLP